MRLRGRLLVSFCVICCVLLALKVYTGHFIRDGFSGYGLGQYARPLRLKSAQTINEHNDEMEQSGKTDVCYYDAYCAPPQILFRIHAETANEPPFACLNDIRLFDAKHVEKGVNVVVLNGTTGDIEHSSSVDVVVSDKKLIDLLRSLAASAVVVVVSFGDVAEMVSADARNALAAYGAQEISKWRLGSAYALIGQRGLEPGHAHEMLTPLSQTSHKVIEGCFDLPLGDLFAVNFTETNAEVHRIDEVQLAALQGAKDKFGSQLQLGKQWPNCGMEQSCPSDSIALHFFSGEHKDDHPRLCVDERMVFDNQLNSAGRGLNLAAVDPKTARVHAVANFDTYQDESVGLEEWLDDVPNGYVVVVVSFDEASTMLSEMTKRIFYEMGSSMVDRLKFRASWYFVGHKGIGAYTPFEDLNIPTGNNWAKPIKTSFCLPRKLSTWMGRPSKVSPLSSPQNLPKRHFCAKYDRHDDFCEPETIDRAIMPRLLTDKSRIGDPVFNMPILIVAGLSTDSLRICLESLMAQEGLNTQMVVVTYDKDYRENADLAALFHVKAVPINMTTTESYNSMVVKSLSLSFSLFSEAPAVAVIEEQTYPREDWLWYLSQTLPALEDHDVDLIQTFNPFGFANISGNPSRVYRISYQPPERSYLLTRRLFEKHIKDNAGCCNSSSPGSWRLGSAAALVPDVSRVLIGQAVALGTKHGTQRTRVYSNMPTEPLDVSFLSSKKYDEAIRDVIGVSKRIPLADCPQWLQQQPTSTGATSVVIELSSDDDMRKAFECFGLEYKPNFITGVYRRMLRLYVNGSIDVHALSKDSPLYVPYRAIINGASNDTLV